MAYQGVVIPVETPRVSLRFGATTNPYSLQNPHKGVDFSPLPGNQDIGLPIVASTEGKVYKSEQNSGYGNYVVIESVLPYDFTARDLGRQVRTVKKGTKLYFVYSHLNERKVSLGQFAQENQVIGTLGNTGYSDFAHLHFEIRIGNYDERLVIDPIDFLTATVVGFRDVVFYA